MKTAQRLIALAAIVVLALVAAGVMSKFSGQQQTQTPSANSRAQTIYITNRATQISNATIERDIPAWEQAVNVDFASYWHTTQYRLVFLGDRAAPVGGMSAVFESKGPIKGALAYHWVERDNAPSITVYAGTGDYYGFDNSVSFTHELFELAANPLTAYVNQGYPDDYYYLEKTNLNVQQEDQYGVLGWFNEVCDPVEADSFLIDGVRISDFVTPAWFNDGVGHTYDYMGLAQQPFWIRPGGYAQYEDANGWELVSNFRSGARDDAGFAKSDPENAEG